MITYTEHLRLKRHHQRQLRREKQAASGKFQKFIAINKESGKATTAITLSRGRIAIGDDVWRMSNKADICEYPYHIYDQFEFNMLYIRKEPEPVRYIMYDGDAI